MIDNNNVFIDGPSSTGKTVLQKHLARVWKKRGWKIFLHNPNGEVGFPADWQTPDRHKFLHVCKKQDAAGNYLNRNYIAILPEADLFAPKPGKEFNWIVNKIRHADALCIAAAQRFTQVSPEVRENCKFACLFRMNKTRAEYWAELFSCDEIARLVPTLKPFHYLHVGPVAGVVQCRVMPPVPLS